MQNCSIMLSDVSFVFELLTLDISGPAFVYEVKAEIKLFTYWFMNLIFTVLSEVS